MGVFGGFIYGGEGVGGDVYGPDVDILSAELISADAVRINFEQAIVVDEAYNDPTNYSITKVSGDGQDVSIRTVLPIGLDTTTEVILVVDKISKDSVYQITVGAAVTSAVGQNVVGAAEFTGRRTKVENILRGLPRHFDQRPESVLRTVLTAIGLSDETIGGSLLEDSAS